MSILNRKAEQEAERLRGLANAAPIAAQTAPPDPPILAALRLSERSQLERVRAENQKLAEIREAVYYFECDPIILERVARVGLDAWVACGTTSRHAEVIRNNTISGKT